MATSPVTVQTSTPSATVIDILETTARSALPVVDDQGQLAGIVSSTDIVRALAHDETRPLLAAQMMSSPVAVASPRESLHAAARRLIAARIHRLVIVENERPVGILSVRDILADLASRRLDTPIDSIMVVEVATVMLGDSVRDALRRLADARVRALVVLDGSSPVGVFTHAEALATRRLSARQLDGPVERSMSHETIFLEPSTPVYRAASYAASMNIRRILVVEHGRLVGLVSSIDLVTALVDAASESASGAEPNGFVPPNPQ